MGTGQLKMTSAAINNLNRFETVHGNSFLSPRPTFLYRITDTVTGALIKYGITSNPIPTRRYSKGFYSGRQMEIIDVGSRGTMAKFERLFTTF